MVHRFNAHFALPSGSDRLSLLIIEALALHSKSKRLKLLNPVPASIFP
jgi:hypothetical protein